MYRSDHFHGVIQIAMILISILPILAGCSPFVTPVVELATVVKTIEVTREVTREITRLVEIPVTITPTLTPDISLTPSQTPTITLTPTITRTPSITNTPVPPIVSVLVHAACNYGPGSAYLYKYGLLENTRFYVLGRNWNNTWLWVNSFYLWNPCWVRADQVRFDSGSLQELPEVYSELPYAANLYRPPMGISANRVGNDVTVFWNAVWMTEDDYRGYLIEAWVCQEQQEVFLPIAYFPPIEQNQGMLAVKIEDEPGCLGPSSARIYTAEKHGYTGFKVIPWPAFESTPQPALVTPTP
jgi:hypothetical protein